MRKQNHSIAPVLKHNSGLSNSVVLHPKHKRPNALKRGVFATPVIIPGEDPREYQELLGALLDEWKPSGPTLQHAVHGLADWMWRLRRLKKSIQTELHVNTFDPRHPAFDDVWGFTMFLSCLRSDPETCFGESARKYLRAKNVDHLTQKFPRSNYQSASEWAKAVTTEILSVLMPAAPGFEPPESEGKVDLLKQATREWQTDQRVVGSIVYARELLEYDDKHTERLQAQIVKQTRHCAELKAMEEMRRT